MAGILSLLNAGAKIGKKLEDVAEVAVDALGKPIGSLATMGENKEGGI